jgi:hypothetical protein
MSLKDAFIGQLAALNIPAAISSPSVCMHEHGTLVVQ